DFADSEFTRDTSESLANARELYLAALELLDLSELEQAFDECPTVVGTVTVGVPGEWVQAANDVDTEVKQIRGRALREGTIAKIRAVLAEARVAPGMEKATPIASRAAAASPPPKAVGAMLAGRSQAAARADLALLARPGVDAAALSAGATAELRAEGNAR